MTPRQKLIEFHAKMTTEARELMIKKNADYAAEGDPFKNFRTFGTFGILVRLSDKLARLQGFEERHELAVKDESIRDTILDVVNYAVLYEAMRTEGEE